MNKVILDSIARSILLHMHICLRVDSGLILEIFQEGKERQPWWAGSWLDVTAVSIAGNIAESRPTGPTEGVWVSPAKCMVIGVTQLIVWFLYCSVTCMHWESQWRGWCTHKVVVIGPLVLANFHSFWLCCNLGTLVGSHYICLQYWQGSRSPSYCRS